MNIVIISVAFIIWAGLHSALASLTVKTWAEARFGSQTKRWYRLFFNVVAVLTLLPVLGLLALLPDRLLYVVRPPWLWLTIGIQVLSSSALIWTVLQTDPLHFAGLKQLAGVYTAGTLQVRGFYAWVRHPLYMFGTLFIWSMPLMTVNTLTLYAWMTLYFVVGSIHEESLLRVEFGPHYDLYCQQVPRLIPLPGLKKKRRKNTEALR